MRFTSTVVTGAFVVESERLEDERGFFARTWCELEFAERGLNPRLMQCSISYNHARGTLRGLHFQTGEAAEAKLVRCTQGAVYDVALDLRPASPTYLRHAGVTLSSRAGNALYIPEGCAHGFLTLTDAAEVFYQMSAPYVAGAGRGVRWDDPAFEIHWPGDVCVISARDAAYPDFETRG